MSSRKPMLSIFCPLHLRMRVSISCNFKALRLIKSKRRPGVPTTIWAPDLRALICFSMLESTVNWANFHSLCYDQSGRVLLDFEMLSSRAKDDQGFWIVASFLYDFQGLASQRLRFSCTSLGFWPTPPLKSQWNGLFLDGTCFYKSSFSKSLLANQQTSKFIKLLFFFFLKMVRSHPIALSIYFSFHDVLLKTRYRKPASFPRK